MKSNKGSGGVDKMQVDELLTHLRENKAELVRKLMEGKYNPKPLRRVEIPKEEISRPQPPPLKPKPVNEYAPIARTTVALRGSKGSIRCRRSHNPISGNNLQHPSLLPGAGILTCFPSSTHFCLDLGAD